MDACRYQVAGGGGWCLAERPPGAAAAMSGFIPFQEAANYEIRLLVNRLFDPGDTHADTALILIKFVYNDLSFPRCPREPRERARLHGNTGTVGHYFTCALLANRHVSIHRWIYRKTIVKFFFSVF